MSIYSRNKQEQKTRAGLNSLLLLSAPAALSVLVVIGLAATVRSQQFTYNLEVDSLSGSNLQPPAPPVLRTPDSIVAAFVKTELQVRQAFNQHTFKRDVALQTIGPNGDVTGEYIRNSQFLFDDKGNRIERVTFRPPSTIRELRITKEDIQDLAGAQLLGIDISEIHKYRLTYLGQETLEGKRVYVLNVDPSVRPDPHRMRERFFVGHIWIDTDSLQIVKVKGVVQPQGKQRFPIFETWREPITAKLNLPARTEADDVLRFPKRDVRFRIRVRYYDYKLFASKLKITEIDEPAN